MVQELNLQSNLISEYRTEIIYDPSMILTHMQIGTSLPILPGFERYILDAIKYYNTRSILLHEHVQNSGTKHVKGFMLVYDDNEDDTLYFGFCGVSDHDPEGIQCLIDELIIHAYENGYSSIKGPINVPTVIFGFGFMKDGSNDSQFIGCPSNPPIYQQVFKKNGFEVVIEEFRFKMPALKMNLDNLEGYDFTEFEFVNPGEENIWEVLPEIKQLHHRFMPASGNITPGGNFNAESHVKFVHDFGKKWMWWYVRHKPTGKMVATGFVIPNPYSTDSKGRPDSVSYHHWVVHEDYRRRGLTMLMYGRTSQQAINRKTGNFIRWGLWPVGADNTASINGAYKMGGKYDRSHLIMELELVRCLL